MIVVHSISQLEQPHSLYLAEDVTEEEGECGIFTHTSIFKLLIITVFKHRIHTYV